MSFSRLAKQWRGDPESNLLTIIFYFFFITILEINREKTDFISASPGSSLTLSLHTYRLFLSAFELKCVVSLLAFTDLALAVLEAAQASHFLH